MTGTDFVRPKRKDRLAIDYELTKGEKAFVFFMSELQHFSDYFGYLTGYYRLRRGELCYMNWLRMHTKEAIAE